MKLLASHNTLTYLPFRWKVMNIFSKFIRCQRINILNQYLDGANIFDIRVRISLSGAPIICHGLADFKGNVYDFLDTMNLLSQRDIIFIQLVNEDTFHESDKCKFMEFAVSVMNRFKGIKFCIVSSKKSWTIEHNDFPAIDNYPMFWKQSKDGGLPLPERYARKNNKENIKKYVESNDGIWWFDFLPILLQLKESYES